MPIRAYVGVQFLLLPVARPVLVGGAALAGGGLLAGMTGWLVPAALALLACLTLVAWGGGSCDESCAAIKGRRAQAAGLGERDGDHGGDERPHGGEYADHRGDLEEGIGGVPCIGSPESWASIGERASCQGMAALPPARPRPVATR